MMLVMMTGIPIQKQQRSQSCQNEGSQIKSKRRNVRLSRHKHSGRQKNSYAAAREAIGNPQAKANAQQVAAAPAINPPLNSLLKRDHIELHQQD
mmetsp:Transcript_20035/g.43430  ORF Transcript_20035/g.43430 Transcript_20035/m.43430 type:complete len:94 (+) Transcript_20035:73-354(+)